MSYKIVYGPDPQPAPTGTSNPRLRAMTAAFLLLGCLGVRTLWPEGTDVLRSLLLPGTPTAAEAAFSDMMTSLREGAPVSESVTAFCWVVVEHGTAP